MSLSIVIPTRNRIDKLTKTLGSIPDEDYIDVHVVCDKDPVTYNFLGENFSHIKRYITKKHIGSVASRNKILENVSNDVIYAVDDIIFEDGSVESIWKTLKASFPDHDGVVGFVQDLSFHPTGMALVGRKFLGRYPKHHLFFPKYWHFACQEIYWFCEFLGNKFVQDKKAKIKHLHPRVYVDLVDQTHLDARKLKSKDMNLIKKREKEGSIWPLS